MQEQDNSISIEEPPQFLILKCLANASVKSRKVIVYMSSHIDMPLN